MQMCERGCLLIIGGKEDKDGDCRILKWFVQLCGAIDGVIGVVASASAEAATVGKTYQDVFADLGIGQVVVFQLNSRADARSRRQLNLLSNCTGIFFTGGDQLRLTSVIGGTAFDHVMRDMLENGLHIAGTSAGASVMSDTMIVGGETGDPPKKCTIKMAPGLGLVSRAVIDQHFAERGRVGRLLSAIGQSPQVIGLGIDEDTALIVYPDNMGTVLGAQTVTVIDGRKIELTNTSAQKQHEPLALTNVIIHVLPDSYRFDLSLGEALRPVE